ncbi:Glycosyltransferase involved in cell wall bisynthesis [Pedobacter steynii]|uniref:Glycosyltransferase involved in cell wall bisynthesis n=1 Tax=Pedobacter steynii TaxID=430522 RepID=A0A1G9RUD7_9SPHI|nr:glycosyltransferase family 2 protein [Pedobacter steynii]NQX37645.1 glycosyltransferase family 2 protein [Pedobacter steynii]SDM26764.1 Glycosyltransferase involved in cell wall bisynthesis [Pedobacter steynii]
MKNETQNNRHQPLISCICITYKRPQQLLQAIANFRDQTYINRELIISHTDDDISTKDLIEKVSKHDLLKITAVERSVKDPLGTARNIAISTAKGEYVCIWDDDDYHAPDRLKYQVNTLETAGTNYQACILSRITLYDNLMKRAYLTRLYNWGGTLLCRRSILLQNPYPSVHLLEDIDLIRFLESKKLLKRIDDTFLLYIYVYHGTNTIDHQHFRYFTRKSFRFNNSFNEIIQKMLNEGTEFLIY